MDNRKNEKYMMSEKLFLNIWEKWGGPEEITSNEEISDFLNELIKESNGLVNLDHFSHINFDYIEYIKYQNPYTLLYWKDLNDLRQKYIGKTILEEEIEDWEINDYVTYSYMLLHINKLKFIKKGNHLFILFLVQVIPNKKIKNFLISSQDELFLEEDNKDNLYKEFNFFEGKRADVKKHFCFVNNLPYYTCLIQPKENNVDTLHSREILFIETLQEIANRMSKVHSSLMSLDEYEYDDLYAQGNIIRRILEYTLKFFCLFMSIEIKIDEKYGYIHLGELRKEINKDDIGINIPQKIVNIANELSHDSGVVFGQDELFDFWNEVNGLIEKVIAELLKTNAQK